MATPIPLLQGEFLRVLTPETVNGIQLRYDSMNMPMYKTSFLPVSAKRHIERANAKRPAHLRHKVEILQGDAGLQVNR